MDKISITSYLICTILKCNKFLVQVARKGTTGEHFTRKIEKNMLSLTSKPSLNELTLIFNFTPAVTYHQTPTRDVVIRVKYLANSWRKQWMNKECFLAFCKQMYKTVIYFGIVCLFVALKASFSEISKLILPKPRNVSGRV